MDFGVAAGKELAGGVVDIDFGEQGAGRGVDGVGRADQLAGEFAAGILRECQGSKDAVFGVR